MKPFDPSDAPPGCIAVEITSIVPSACCRCCFELERDCGARACCPDEREDGHSVYFLRKLEAPSAPEPAAPAPITEDQLRAGQRATPAGRLLAEMGMSYYDTESSARRVAEHAAAEIERLRHIIADLKAGK